MTGLPKKYREALALLESKDQAGFIKFAETGKLAFDVSNVSGYSSKDRTLFEAAVHRKLWDCVAFMVDHSAPTYQDVAQSYGYAPADLSERIWRAFIAANGGKMPHVIQETGYRERRMSMIEACAESFCHCALLQRVISEGETPSTWLETRQGDRLPLALWLLSSDVFNAYSWTSDSFDWLTSTFTLKQLNVNNGSIESLLFHWARCGADIAENCFDDANGAKAEAAERVFWKLEEMHTEKSEFARHAAKIKPNGVTRFATILACIGVLSDTPADKEVKVTTEVVCTHCSGTGKVVGVDTELAQAAKKRRVEKMTSK